MVESIYSATEIVFIRSYAMVPKFGLHPMSPERPKSKEGSDARQEGFYHQIFVLQGGTLFRYAALVLSPRNSRHVLQLYSTIRGYVDKSKFVSFLKDDRSRQTLIPCLNFKLHFVKQGLNVCVFVKLYEGSIKHTFFLPRVIFPFGHLSTFYCNIDYISNKIVHMKADFNLLLKSAFHISLRKVL